MRLVDPRKLVLISPLLLRKRNWCRVRAKLCFPRQNVNWSVERECVDVISGAAHSNRTTISCQSILAMLTKIGNTSLYRWILTLKFSFFKCSRTAGVIFPSSRNRWTVVGVTTRYEKNTGMYGISDPLRLSSPTHTVHLERSHTLKIRFVN